MTDRSVVVEGGAGSAAFCIMPVVTRNVRGLDRTGFENSADVVAGVDGTELICGGVATVADPSTGVSLCSGTSSVVVGIAIGGGRSIFCGFTFSFPALPVFVGSGVEVCLGACTGAVGIMIEVCP